MQFRSKTLENLAQVGHGLLTIFVLFYLPGKTWSLHLLSQIDADVPLEPISLQLS